MEAVNCVVKEVRHVHQSFCARIEPMFASQNSDVSSMQTGYNIISHALCK